MPDLWMDVDAALAEVPVNILALTDDTDFKTRETAIVYNQAGMDLVWNFVTTAGAMSQTAVTPTTSGDYDWVNQGDAMYSIEMPASGGASINNDTEGFGWFTGIATGVLHWRGPVIGFRAAGLNNALIDSAYSATRGLSGTALPNAVADATGGLPISDAGGLDLDSRLDVDMSSRAPAATALSTATWTTARAGYLDNLNIGGLVASSAQIGALNNFNPAVDTVANVTLVATCSVNTDMRGTDSAALAITALSNTIWTNARAAFLDNLDTGSLVATASQVAGLHNFDPDNDLVAAVIAVGTCVSNTDMRGTDGANTTVPDVAGTAAALHVTTDTAIAGVQTDTTAIKAKTDNLPSGVKKNVALSGFTFLMVNGTDHVTPEPGLTVTGQILQDGGAFAALTNAVVEIGNGVYKIDLTQAEMNAGIITLKFTATGADQRTLTIITSA